MRCDKFLAALVAASSLMGRPALGDSPDWKKLQADYDAAPSNKIEMFLSAIQGKIALPSGAPAKWTTIVIHPGDDNINAADRSEWTRRSDGLISQKTAYCGCYYDPLGLIDFVGNANERYSKVTISAAVPLASPISMTEETRRLSAMNGAIYSADQINVMYSGTSQALDVSYSGVVQYANGGAPDRSQDQYREHFDSRFGVFVDDRDTLLDWQIGTSPWHSLSVSAGLTKAQKEQARQLFARGFDLYKAGDLKGAEALLQAGMKIDPGNHLAWFTLAEISRSEASVLAFDSNMARWHIESFERVYYQHTIDLAPDSHEATLAKGHLDALR